MGFFKTAFKVIVALLLGLGFLAVFTLADSIYQKQDTQRLGKEAIENDNIEFFIGSRFYNKIPYLKDTFTQNNRTYDLYIYEVAGYVKKNDEITARKGMNIIVHQKDGQPLDKRMVARFHFKDEYEPMNLILIQIADLPVYVLYYHNRDTYTANIELDVFYEEDTFKEIESFEISFEHIGGSTVLYQLSINPQAFTFDEVLVEYYQTHESVPTEETGIIGISSSVSFTLNPLVWVWTALYVVVVLGTYIGFKLYFRYKKMGRKALTPGLEKDIEKLKQ